jgi:hypothetical protein
LTDDILDCSYYHALLIMRDNITVDGDGYKITGTGDYNGIVLQGVDNVTLQHFYTMGFENGILVRAGDGNNIYMNRMQENAVGLSLSEECTGTTVNNNIIADNNLGLNVGTSGNSIYHNQFINNIDMIEDIGGNTWGDPVDEMGNHWSNYWGLDDGSNGRIAGDFIGDTDLPHEGVDGAPVMDPSMIGPFLAGDFLEYWGWLIWRGGWSPVDIWVTNPAGQTISRDEDEIGLDAFYVEYDGIQPGTKLVYVSIGINPLNSYEGVYTFEMTGQEDLTYWMEWFASDSTGRLVYQAVEDMPLAAGETRHVDMILKKTVDPETGDTIIVARQIVPFDIKPQSCPNPLNVKSKGVLPVAILGRPDFDVSTIDPATVLLEGVAPTRHSIEDVATPTVKEDSCDCTSEGPDGYDDFTLKFRTQAIVAALGEVHDGDTPVLTITGALTNGTPFEGYDCVLIKKKGGGGPHDAGSGILPLVFDLADNMPNPCKRFTLINYQLPKAVHTTLEIYDASGRLVRTLVDDTKQPGFYAVSWDGKDRNSSNLPSGIYFYRLEAGAYNATKKMLLLR